MACIGWQIAANCRQFQALNPVCRHGSGHDPHQPRPPPGDRSLGRLRRAIGRRARAVEKPFFHLEFDAVFPADLYAQILALMPEATDYPPMHGRSKGHDLTDGTYTRVKIDLFPESLRT